MANSSTCHFCGKSFNDVSGRFLRGLRQCWRCQLEEIYGDKEIEKIKSRFEILDIR